MSSLYATYRPVAHIACRLIDSRAAAVAIRTEVFPQESNGRPVRTVSVFVQKGDKVQLADSTDSTRLYNALNIYPGSIFNQTIVSMAVNRLCIEPNIKSANTDYSARNTALQNLQKNVSPHQLFYPRGVLLL